MGNSRQIIAMTVRLRVCLTMVVSSLPYLLSGCGGDSGVPVFPVSGTVYFDGKPAEGVRVIFHPDTAAVPGKPVLRPSGETGADGGFYLTSREPKDGAPVGKYRITLTWRKAAGSAGPQGMGGGEARESGADQFGGRYTEPTTSGLEFEVREGENSVPKFDLKRG